MNHYLQADLHKRFTRLMASVFSGQAAAPVTIAVISICALLLLVYVSAGIYSSVLSERISDLEKQQLLYRERVHVLTGKYTQLASRERVAGYCENVLGMIEADWEGLERITVERRELPSEERIRFRARRQGAPELLGLLGAAGHIEE